MNKKIISLTGKPFETKKPSIMMPSIMMGRPISRTPMWENQIYFQRAFLTLANEGYQMNMEDLESMQWWLKHHSSSRNKIASAFMARDDDYLVWIDDDTTFLDLAVAIKQAIALDKDIVMGVSSCKPVPHFPHLGKFNKIGDSGTIIDASSRHVYDFPLDKLFEIDFGSFGFVVMKRKVIEGMPPPWFYFPPNYQTNNVWGEDVTFCYNAKMYGFEIWCDPTIFVGHLGYTSWHHKEQGTCWLQFKKKLMEKAKKDGFDCSHNLYPDVQKVFKSAPGIKRMDHVQEKEKLVFPKGSKVLYGGSRVAFTEKPPKVEERQCR